MHIDSQTHTVKHRKFKKQIQRPQYSSKTSVAINKQTTNPDKEL